MARRYFAFAILILAPAATFPSAREAKPASVAGNWKFTLPFVRDGEQAVWLVKLEDKGGKLAGSVLANAKAWPKGKIDNVSADKGVLKFEIGGDDLKFACEFDPAKESKGKIAGRALLRKRSLPAEIERTEIATLDEFDLIRDELKREPTGHRAIKMALALLQDAEERKVEEKELAKWLKIVTDESARYGPAFQREMLTDAAAAISSSKAYLKSALGVVKQAERLLEDKSSPVDQKKVLDVLADVLGKLDRPDDAKDVNARIAKLDFAVKVRPYAATKARSKRVVLVELFTGAQCGPCVAADLAFDAVGKSYKPTEVVMLQYHLHVPGPDPLTNPDGESRAEYFGKAVQGTPAILFNGKVSVPGGGGRADAPEKYDDYLEAIDPLLDVPAQGEIGLTASGKGGKLTIVADVKGLAQAGDDVRLRVALVEDVVEYKGGNGIAQHHQVVRAMPGGPNGTVLKEKATKVTLNVDVAEVKKKLGEYLESAEKRNPFPGKERPMELKKLRVVAFVQNDKTGEVYQAAQAEVAEGK